MQIRAFGSKSFIVRFYFRSRLGQNELAVRHDILQDLLFESSRLDDKDLAGRTESETRKLVPRFVSPGIRNSAGRRLFVIHANVCGRVKSEFYEFRTWPPTRSNAFHGTTDRDDRARLAHGDCAKRDFLRKFWTEATGATGSDIV